MLPFKADVDNLYESNYGHQEIQVDENESKGIYIVVGTDSEGNAFEVIGLDSVQGLKVKQKFILII